MHGLPWARSGRSAQTDGEVVVSTAFLDKPPYRGQETQAELWGVLPVHGNSDEGLFAFSSGNMEGAEAEEDPKIHEGTLLELSVPVAAIAVGGAHVIFVADDGRAFAYGRNDRGQLGVGDFDSRPQPVQVELSGLIEDVEHGMSFHSTPRGMPPPPSALQPNVLREFSAGFMRKDSLSHMRRGNSLSIVHSDSDLDPVAQPSAMGLGEESTDNLEWVILAAACGSGHTLLLAHPMHGSPHAARVFACGAWEALGIDTVGEDQNAPQVLPEPMGVVAIAARAEASCCAAPALQSEVGKKEVDIAPDVARDHWVYIWGEVKCCVSPDFFAVPTPVFRVPAEIKAVRLGGFFGLALDADGVVYAWGDGTYGELGGAGAGWPLGHAVPESGRLPVPGTVRLPVPTDGSSSRRRDNDDEVHHIPSGDTDLSQRGGFTAQHSSLTAGRSSSAGLDGSPPKHSAAARRRPRVVDLACGERHSLLLEEEGHVFAFGENLAGQCGVPEAVGTGHITGSTVPRPQLVPVEGPRRGGGARDGDPRPYELGARVFAGRRHSAMVTRDHRLYVWGHPSNRKLGHAGFNPDGTEAGEHPSKDRPPGVAVRSALRDAVQRPRLVYSQLHRRVRALGLGDECTVIVTGEGAAPDSPVTPAAAAAPGAASVAANAEAAPPLPHLRSPGQDEEPHTPSAAKAADVVVNVHGADAVAHPPEEVVLSI